MEERRKARVGTVSGLALLTGGTALAAVAGGAHSIFATMLLGTLTIGMAHALRTEIHRQAHRISTTWVIQDTLNAVLLAAWAVGALIMTVLAVVPTTVRAVGLALTLWYALSSVYFIIQRRRALATV